MRKQMIAATTIAELNIPRPLYDDYGKNIKDEIEFNRAARVEAETQELLNLDHERDVLLVYFMVFLHNARQSPIETQRLAAENIEIRMKPYTNIQNKVFGVETLHIKGLIADIKKPKYTSSVKTLKLENLFELLDRANQAYEDMIMQRTNARSVKVLENSKIVRLRTDTNYNEICDLINASYLLAQTEEAKTKINMLINQMNEVIMEYKIIAEETIPRACH